MFSFIKKSRELHCYKIERQLWYRKRSPHKHFRGPLGQSSADLIRDYSQDIERNGASGLACTNWGKPFYLAAFSALALSAS